MPSKRSKKKRKAVNLPAASDYVERLSRSDNEDTCHSWQSLASSSTVRHAAATAWHWQSMPTRDVEQVLQQVHQGGLEETEDVALGAYTCTIECSNCTESLAIALRQQSKGLVLPADVAELEQKVAFIQKAAASEPTDAEGVAGRSGTEFSLTLAAELALCATRPGALLQPAGHTSSGHTVHLMLQQLSGNKARAVELCAAGAHAEALTQESAPAAVHEWLVQIALNLKAASSTASMAFLSGSANDCAQLDEAMSSLWARYEHAIEELQLSDANYRRQQLRSQRQPAALRAAMHAVLASHCEVLCVLHDEVQRVLSGEGVLALLQHVQPLQHQWETPLLQSGSEQHTSSFSVCDELHLQLLLQQVRQCSLVPAPVAPAQLVCFTSELAGKDKALVKDIRRLDAAMSSCRCAVTESATTPPTAVERQALQRWQAEYELKCSTLEQQAARINDHRQTQQQQQEAAYGEAVSNFAEADSRYLIYKELVDEDSTAVEADSICSGLRQQRLAMGLEVQLLQQEGLLGAVQASSAVLALLSRRYWLTRQFCAKLQAHAAVHQQHVEQLCSDSAAAERRLEVIQACCLLEAVDSACREWSVKQREQQLLEELLEEADAASAAK
jgi:hypothetical protein